ncbi:hypothetical protein MNBD_GAMMA23-1093 [hydrothermal vent metagenome]|uniref:Alanyl-tRNA synthetase n=1 Tax=hydrothermal vent metagenome TaxID=652676 RepID=A0A3B1A305_9ZZZZ
MVSIKIGTVSLILLTGIAVNSAVAAYTKKPSKASTEFKAEVVDAWLKAGALTGYLAHGKSGGWHYLRKRPDGVNSLPVFLWTKFKPGVMARLPAPSVSFAISLGATKIDNAGLDELARFKYLRSLDISHTKVTDKGLGKLAAITSLRSLDLGASYVTDAGLRSLSKIRHLRNFYFGSTAVTDKGVTALAQNKNMRILYLYKTQVTDMSLKVLAELRSLKILYLAKTKVTEKGLAELRKARPKLRIEN